MKREDLEKIGLTDKALIDAIMEAHGKDIEKHKTAAEAVKAEAEAIKAQLAEAGKQIESFKGMDIEGVKKSADDWKAKAEQAQKDAEAQVNQIKFDVSLKEALGEWKVKDPSDIIPHLKRDKLQMGDDGKIIGLKEQIEPLKTAKAYLFSDTKPVPEIVTSTANKPIISDKVVDAARQYAGLPNAQGK